MALALSGAPRRALFTVVIFGGSFLLFLVQPLVARMALPLLGGAPGVWNSAMLVFQVLLLGGYAYAHAISRLTIRRQATVHLALLAVAAATLPITLADIPPPAPGWEVLWAPALFMATVGPVFLLLSAQASLMQRWYAAAPDAGNPYRLYAASNIGSFAGLLTYPFWMEPRMALGEQSRAWAIGYALLIALVVLAALSRWHVTDQVRPAPTEKPEPIDRRRLLLWLALAAVPSGLMLSTTTLLTTDLMAMPLLWVIPLGLYLLSFSVAFSDSGDWARILTRYTPIPLLMIGSLAMISGGQSNPALALAMVALLFVVAVALHSRLYELRPSPARLTYFYLLIAAGGALGGTFTALLAPVMFDWVYEHAILLLAAALLIPQNPFLSVLERFWYGAKQAWWAAAAAVLLAAILAWQLAGAVEIGAETPILVFALGLVLLGVVVIGKRWAFVAILAIFMLGFGGFSTLQLSLAGDRSRSYFGVYAIERSEDGGLRRLVHGTTMHGQQWIELSRRTEPSSYYGPGSGAGLVLSQASGDATVGVAGLGVGTLACYRKPGQEWIFYEIDERVARYSQDRVFTFLADCTPDARIVIGDARLELAKEPESSLDLLVIDAFTSDAIPMHLLTAEAFDTYGRALGDDGLLLVHVSNRFLNLAPMVSALAQAGQWHGVIRRDPGDPEARLTASDWIALSRSEAHIQSLELASDYPWDALPPPVARAWTDDHASLVSLFRF